jgi:CelD/BcsL family acetyltransferase involved in cellulose biosynthesis
MLGYQYGGCYYYTDVGFDPAYAKWSVGSVLQLKVLQDLYQQDGRPELFDFSTGYGEHKERFGSESRLEANVLLMPRTVRARWIAASFLASEWLSSTVQTRWTGLASRQN